MTPLCQRGPKSCGACCGLYNRADPSRAAVTADLWRRTRALSGVERSEAAYREAAARLAQDAPASVFPSVRICQLLGFLDAAGTRIGCLAHPLVTGGPDLRGAGAYDVLTCEAFLCPSHAWLSEEEAGLAEVTCEDWHDYGLVVTDAPFLRAVLAGVEARVGARVERCHLAHPPLRAALARLLSLKEELEPGSDGHFGAFQPARRPEEAGGEPAGPGSATTRASPREAILACLGADPRSGNDLDRLEAEVGRRLDACAQAWAWRPGPQPRR